MSDPKPKRPAPFCIRLSDGERAQLEHDAGGLPLGAYIKSRMFGGAGSRKADRHALSRLLAVLGASGIARNLDELAQAARSGSLPIDPGTQGALRAAVADIAEIRRLLMEALGFRSGP
jgi:hypothetical protein